MSPSRSSRRGPWLARSRNTWEKRRSWMCAACSAERARPSARRRREVVATTSAESGASNSQSNALANSSTPARPRPRWRRSAAQSSLETPFCGLFACRKSDRIPSSSRSRPSAPAAARCQAAIPVHPSGSGDFFSRPAAAVDTNASRSSMSGLRARWPARWAMERMAAGLRSVRDARRRLSWPNSRSSRCPGSSSSRVIRSTSSPRSSSSTWPESSWTHWETV